MQNCTGKMPRIQTCMVKQVRHVKIVEATACFFFFSFFGAFCLRGLSASCPRHFWPSSRGLKSGVHSGVSRGHAKGKLGGDKPAVPGAKMKLGSVRVLDKRT